MAKSELDRRIGFFSAEPGYPVRTAWDIGYGEDTAIWPSANELVAQFLNDHDPPLSLLLLKANRFAFLETRGEHGNGNFVWVLRVRPQFPSLVLVAMSSISGSRTDVLCGAAALARNESLWFPARMWNAKSAPHIRSSTF
jgi:hypothetical protein